MSQSNFNSSILVPDSPDTIKGDSSTNPDVDFEDCLFCFINPYTPGFNYLHLVIPSFYRQAASSLGKNFSVISIIRYLCHFIDFLNDDYDILFAFGDASFNGRVTKMIRLHKFDPNLDFEKLFNYKSPPVCYPAVAIIYDIGVHYKDGFFC